MSAFGSNENKNELLYNIEMFFRDGGSIEEMFDVLSYAFEYGNTINEKTKQIENAIDYIESNPLVMIGEYNYFVNDILSMEESCSKMSFIRTLLKILKGE